MIYHYIANGIGTQTQEKCQPFEEKSVKYFGNVETNSEAFSQMLDSGKNQRTMKN